jgi:isopropylmalate/homocitrate/citramalate synthase
MPGSDHADRTTPQRAIAICDVGPRDGLQNSTVVLPATVRAEFASRIARAGLDCVEVVSFVNSARVPQMADAEAVCEGLDRSTSASLAGLVLNRRGLSRALSCGLDEVHLAYPLTDTFALRNQGCDAPEAAGAATEMVQHCVDIGTRVTVTLGVSFGCPFEGAVAPGIVASHAAALVDAGADQIVLADTVGFAFPRQVHTVLRRVLEEVSCSRLGIHLHNTRNTGYANALAALEEGVFCFDASTGGIGGCPFAPTASGNVATEDLVHLLEGEGINTEVDLDQLIRTAQWLQALMPDLLPGLVHRAGLTPDLTPSFARRRGGSSPPADTTVTPRRVPRTWDADQ